MNIRTLFSPLIFKQLILCTNILSNSSDQTQHYSINVIYSWFCVCWVDIDEHWTLISHMSHIERERTHTYTHREYAFSASTFMHSLSSDVCLFWICTSKFPLPNTEKQCKYAKNATTIVLRVTLYTHSKFIVARHGRHKNVCVLCDERATGN